ncbi:DgyrCDS1111 [Dimorphilus gyrociliatus]|uniref:Serine/threonine-protein kinase PLK n=1 Tax=Dimorphilus gyrociliatus TaxID=2664684 RepID=A0A7I8V9F5_9ANNE|nr:DgyrCDS1111 [Dimorphilus gyrociliatus]
MINTPRRSPLVDLERDQWDKMRPERAVSSPAVNVISKVQKVCTENLRDLTEKTRAGCCVPVAKQSVKENHRPQYVPTTTTTPNRRPAPPSYVSHNEPIRDIYDKETGNKYSKGKILGKGGFAKCYELTDLKTGKLYAGKVIAKTRIAKQNQRDKFKREVELHSSLKHEHVVRFYSCFEDDDNVYIVLEKCSKKSLMHVLRRRKKITEPEVRYYIKQLMSAMHYIHQRRIIHRDLKLGNMLLNSYMSLKIADFGLAAQLRYEGEKLQTVCGTPNYIAPEVLKRTGYSYEADIWAIGCIMYALLDGKPPFETPTLDETYERIKTNKYYLPPTLSSEVKLLIAKLLSPEQHSRPSLKELDGDAFFSSGYVPPMLHPSACETAPHFNISSIRIKSAPASSNHSHSKTINSTISQTQQSTVEETKQINGFPSETKKSCNPQRISPSLSLTPPSPTNNIKAKSVDDFLKINRNNDMAVPILQTPISIGANDDAHDCPKPKMPEANEKPAESLPVNPRPDIMPIKPALAVNSNEICYRSSRSISRSRSRSKSPFHHNSRDRKSSYRQSDLGYGLLSQSSWSLLKTLSDCIEKMPLKGKTPPALKDTRPLWVTKWVDFSNRYGFGFLLSDGCVGVLFNDLTRAVLSADKKLAHLNDLSNEIVAFDPSDPPTEELNSKASLLKFFSDYMDKYLIHGGDVLRSGKDLEKSLSNPGVFMKKWFRTPLAIVMMLSNGVLQVNFFKDHTKVVVTPQEGKSLVTFVNSSRQCTSYSLSQIQQFGCDSTLRERLIYVRHMLQKSLDKKSMK